MPTAGDKRKAVDDAFERLFGYKWGTRFGLDGHREGGRENLPSRTQQLIGIFGMEATARILGTVRPASKSPKVTPVSTSTLMINYKDIEMPKTQFATTVETKLFAGQAVQTTVKQSETESQPAKAKTGTRQKMSGIDKLLEQINGPQKMSTVQKTSNDWENFKEADKQLQDELEKNAQGKDAFLVKQDFLTRVDQRKFELERDERDRERAKRATS